MTGNSYTNTFGGETINPTLLSYVNYPGQDTSLTLVWPLEAPPDSNIAADKIDVDMTMPNLHVSMPAANEVSPGQDVLIRNTGIERFSVFDFDGIEIGSVASGEAWYFVVIDNDTEAGQWYAIQFGAGTSAATAASLAGAGLIAHVNQLDQNLITNAQLGNHTVTSADLATVLQNNGGAVVYTFNAAATLGGGFFAYFINAGSGSMVLTAAGGDTIDGAATKTLAPTESCILFSDGVNALHSLGYGRSIVNTVTGASIDASGSGTLSLSASQVQAQVQDFTGTLTGNRIIDYGGGVGYWFVYNNTAGAFTMTYRVSGLDAGVTVAQGSFSIVRSNGSNMAIAFTATTGTVTSVATTTDLTGGPITTTGTLGLSSTGVAAGSYGSASQTLTESVTAVGRVTALAAVPIAITSSQVTDFAAAVAAAVLALEPVGTYKWTALSTYGSGYLKCDSKTIGNASSNGTARANADTSALFTALWNDYHTLGTLQIFTSAGVVSTFGASAATDFAANKALALPDGQGRIMAMLSGATGRLTSATITPDGNTLGGAGGVQQENTTASVSGNVVVSSGGVGVTVTGNTTSATQPVDPAGGTFVVGLGDTISGSGITNTITANGANTLTGTTGTVTNVQPTIIGNLFIKFA
jgi:hypothetical protein